MAKIVISGKEVEEARVVWFHPEKRYGFAEIYRYQVNNQIFFHFNDGRLVDFDEKIENFIFKDAAGSKTLQDPRIGDQILFVRATGKKGPKASPWTPVDDFIGVESVFSDLNRVCDCGHKVKEHAGGTECMYCNCGHDDWPGSFNDPDIFREVNLGDSAGGFKIYE